MDTWVAGALDASGDVPRIQNAAVLAKAYFCPRCQQLRLLRHCHATVRSKHCPQCLTKYHPDSEHYRCVKNCFECPQCHTSLGITVDDVNNGKQFQFLCRGCSYSYQTKVIHTAKSLHTIVKDEIGGTQTQWFRQVARQLSSNATDSSALDEVTKANLKLLGIKVDDDIEPPSITDTTLPPIPQGRKLCSKFSVKCGECRTILQEPMLDVKLPAISKFHIKSLAIDVVPQIKATLSLQPVLQDGKPLPVVLSIISPLKEPLMVTLAAPSILPSDYTSLPDNVVVGIRLPTAKFTVGPSSIEDAQRELVKRVPVVMLTNFSPVAAAELVLRRGNAPQFPTSVSHFKESGHYWTLVGLELSLEENQNEVDVEGDIKIPIYMSISSAEQDSQKQDRLRFGVWTILDLGTIATV
ncbi:hypothetical protein JNB11_07180 [Kocuria palustris]|nr:hypothetical protein [Kocuria palustris]